MSFLKIADSKKRAFIVYEYLKSSQNIKTKLSSERVGDVSTQYEHSELFKPVTDMEKNLKEGLVSELKPIREGMKSLHNISTISVYNSLW